MAQPTNGDTPAQPDPDSNLPAHASPGLRGFLLQLSEHPELMFPPQRILGPCYLEVAHGPRGNLMLQIHHVGGQETLLCGVDPDTLKRLAEEGQPQRTQVASALDLARLTREHDERRN